MPYKDPQAARLASRERVRRYRKRQSIAKKLGPSAVEVTGDPADVLAAWSAATLVVPAGHPNAGQPMTLPPYGVEFLRETRRGAPLGDQDRRMGVQTGSRGPEHGAAARLRRPTRHSVAAGTTAPAGGAGPLPAVAGRWVGVPFSAGALPARARPSVTSAETSRHANVAAASRGYVAH